MLKSQRHYYWIGGAVWGLLMLGGIAFLLLAGGGGQGAGMGDLFDSETYPAGVIVAGDDALRAERGVRREDLGSVVIGEAGLQITDPLEDADRPLPEVELPAGAYDVSLYSPEDAPRVLGILALHVAEGEITRWESLGRKGRPIDLGLEVDAVLALGDAGAVSALVPEEVEAALAASDAPVPRARIGDVLLLDPSFETFSSGLYAGYSAEGDLLVVVKDFGYFGVEAALERRAGENADTPTEDPAE